MSKKEKQIQQPKEELTAEQLKGVDGAEGIFQTNAVVPNLEQEQLDAELAQEGGMIGGFWTIKSGAGLYGASNAEHLFPFFGEHKDRGRSTLALLCLYAFLPVYQGISPSCSSSL